MGAQGTATLDFGAFPGKSDASVAVTGQAGIGAASIVEAWLLPAGTTDHTADEHMVETLHVVAATIVAGTGFTIYGFNTSQLNEPLSGWTNTINQLGEGLAPPPRGGAGTLIYGKWNVAWVWN